ncbi:MAG: DUF2070 family protein [Promethearchaeota archaeon]
MSNVGKAPTLYGTLFRLPSMETLLSLMIISSLFTGVFVHFISGASDFLFLGLVEGGLIFLVPSIVSAIVSYSLIHKETEMLIFRHMIAISTSATVLWNFIYVFCAVLSWIFQANYIIVDGFFIGMALALTVRLLTYFPLSFSGPIRNSISAVIQPGLSFLLACLLQITTLGFLLANIAYWIPRFAISTILMTSASFGYMYLTNRPLKKSVGIGGLSFLRAFLTEWVASDSSKIERYFERLGKKKDLTVSTILFKTLDDRQKAIMVVPYIHPGPFRNVGSSNLPTILINDLESKFGATTLVFHGPSTHADNLAAAQECQKVLEQTEKMVRASKNEFALATPLTKVKESGFEVGCQIFGDFVVLIITSAPKDTEDIPHQTAQRIIKTAKGMGIKHVTIIDAHNAKSPEMDKEPVASGSEEEERLILVIKKAISEALAAKKAPLKIGTARIRPSDGGRQKGIGDSGIMAQILEVGGQRTAYILIDGNNMIRGLREEILESLEEIGIKSAEIMTTDSHSVDATTLEAGNAVGKRYHPSKIVEHVRVATKQAIEDLEVVKGYASIDEVEDLAVAGEVVDEIIESTSVSWKTAKRAFPLIVIAFLMTLVIFMIL